MRRHEFICESAGKPPCNLTASLYAEKVLEIDFFWLRTASVKTMGRMVKGTWAAQCARKNLVLVYEDCHVKEVIQTSNGVELPHSLRSHVAQDLGLDFEWKTTEFRLKGSL